MGTKKITLVLSVEIEESEWEKALEYIDHDNLYDLLDMAIDWEIEEVEHD